jgi:3-isopropylmalate dehydrogenase
MRDRAGIRATPAVHAARRAAGTSTSHAANRCASRPLVIHQSPNPEGTDVRQYAYPTQVRLRDHLGCLPDVPHGPGTRHLLGVLEGTGIGPTVVGAALDALDAAARVLDLTFDVRRGGLIGEAALAEHGTALPESTAAFCGDILERGGAILSGPGGGRYVYDLRRRFDLFCKLVPVRPHPELARAGRVPAQYLHGVDILIVRDNIGGVYQGEWSERDTSAGRVATHAFSYREADVRRLAEIAARAAAARRGDLTVVVKDGGAPSVTALWRDVGSAVGARWGLTPRFVNVDALAYDLIQHPARFDVIVAPNLFGDILADLAGVLVGSRGVTFSGNFDAMGRGVYQTNHGCAHDLAGTDTANPAGQLLSLAMLLREAFGLDQAAALIEQALAAAWRDGWRTADIAEPGCTVVGTRAMAARVTNGILRSAPTRA